MRFFCLLPLAALAGGCVTADRQAALPAVNTALAERSDSTLALAGDDTEDAVRALLAAPLTIDRTVQIALLNNRELRVTLEELGLSQAEVAAAARLANPSFSAGIRWPHDAPRVPEIEFGLTLEILDAMLLPLRRRLAEEQLAITQQHAAQAVLTLIGEVKAAGYEWLARQDYLERVNLINDVNQAATTLAQRQFDAGNINELALAGLQTIEQEGRLDVLHAGSELRAAREKINRLLALHGPQTEWTFPGPLPALPSTDDQPAHLEARALAQRLDLAAARTGVVRAEKNLLLRQRTRLLPVGVAIGANTERGSDRSRKTGAELEIGLPIFDQGQPEIARLSAELRQASARAEALANEIRSEVRSASDRLASSHQAAALYHTTLLPQRQRLLRQTLLHYNAMQVSVYALLEAKEQQQHTEQAAIEARRDYWLARVALEQAVGGKL